MATFFQASPLDVPVVITTPSGPSSSTDADARISLAAERRITPSWTVDRVKAKLEPVTGVPPGSQRLLLKLPGHPPQWIEGSDRTIGEWGIVKGCEIEVDRQTDGRTDRQTDRHT